MIVIDYKDSRPIYEQIADKFKLLILKGVLKPEEQMPSIRSLSVELSINPNTIQKAYAKLEQENYIYSVKGRGNFVSYDESLLDRKKQEFFTRFETYVKEALEIGIKKEELVDFIQQRI